MFSDADVQALLRTAGAGDLPNRRIPQQSAVPAAGNPADARAYDGPEMVALQHAGATR
ncbi:MAG: hypothetical protein ABSG43_18905 [Solirubrobacteraceae bacterium]|jgi:hypothetical protein